MKKMLACLLCLVTTLEAEERPLGLTTLTEELPSTKLKITDTIPTWLNGTYIYNGPAFFNIGDTYVSPWYDGLGMLHSFTFSDGEVYYQNKFLRTSAFEKVIVEDSLDYPGFGQVSTKVEPKFIPNANVNVAKFANSFVALTETPLPVIFDPLTLNTVGLYSYNDTLPQSRVWECAHPQYEPETGDIINYQVQFFPEAQYVIYRMKKGSNAREIIAKIPVANPSYMHSFALTANYIVLTEFPLVIDPQDILKGGAFKSHYKWKPERGMRILLISRKNGDIVGAFKAEPVFAWHHINSFEEDGVLTIDMAAYQDASTFLEPDVKEDPEHNRVARFVRYKVQLATKKVIKEQVGPSIEMPRINYDRYNTKPYHSVYGYDDYNIMWGLKRRGLVKIDARTKQATNWSFEDYIANEPLFIPAPLTSAPKGKTPEKEDAGVVISCVLDIKKRTSFLIMLDGEKFTEIARVEVPHHIPYGLHGQFFGK
ncbi:MAG: carotenoid oxygenase family protein [Chlamydiales bacterium]|nr:carotenoid oxygenase family protein [Chlamydiales bacterium]